MVGIFITRREELDETLAAMNKATASGPQEPLAASATGSVQIAAAHFPKACLINARMASRDVPRSSYATKLKHDHDYNQSH